MIFFKEAMDLKLMLNLKFKYFHAMIRTSYCFQIPLPWLNLWPFDAIECFPFANSVQDSDLFIVGLWDLKGEKKASVKHRDSACSQGIRPQAKEEVEKGLHHLLLPRKASCCFDNSNVPLVQSYQLSKQLVAHSRLTAFHYREADPGVIESK